MLIILFYNNSQDWNRAVPLLQAIRVTAGRIGSNVTGIEYARHVAAPPREMKVEAVKGGRWVLLYQFSQFTYVDATGFKFRVE